ncbi:hypothetical protein B0H15DRAFT_867251 [Mycena belliarum]|uniref:Uncharacterized protein n=1 Tax=Mycena belliarum TaxID=1033014 RepID=A0AAD6TPA6_9AGAR|nr:hypothetical protein B0H15DRAFT_867251 [Mycena belliae]
MPSSSSVMILTMCNLVSFELAPPPLPFLQPKLSEVLLRRSLCIWRVPSKIPIQDLLLVYFAPCSFSVVSSSCSVLKYLPFSAALAFSQCIMLFFLFFCALPHSSLRVQTRAGLVHGTLTATHWAHLSRLTQYLTGATSFHAFCRRVARADHMRSWRGRPELILAASESVEVRGLPAQ